MAINTVILDTVCLLNRRATKSKEFIMKLLFCALLAIVATAESLQQAPSFRCEPDSVFKIDCNTCRCSRNGEHALCTLKACIHLPDPLATHGTRKSRSVEVPKTVKPEQVCEPGSTFKDYCNTCKCSDDGKDSVCTLMDCDENIWNKDGTRKAETSEETTIFPTEQYETTEYDEYAMELPGICTEIKTFNHYCNFCECTAVGDYPLCTAMGCSTRFWNKDGTRTSEVEIIDGTTQPPLEDYTAVAEDIQ